MSNAFQEKLGICVFIVIGVMNPAHASQSSKAAVYTTVAQGSWYRDSGATAFDNFDGDLTSDVASRIYVNTRFPGIYMVAYQVADSSGNVGRALRFVNVVADSGEIPEYPEPHALELSPDTTGDNYSNEPDGIPDAENDYDGDGMRNADEIAWGFDPLDPESFGQVPVMTPLGIACLVGSILLAGRRLLPRLFVL